MPHGPELVVFGLLALVVAGAVTYGAGLFFLHGERIRTLRSVISRARGRGTPVPETT